MPVLDRFYRDHHEDVGILVIACNQNASEVNALIADRGYYVPVLLDPTSSISNSFGLSVLGTVVFIDSVSEIVDTWSSTRDADDLWAKARSLLFSDTSGSPYEAAILDLAGAGIISGFPDGTFRPNVSVTRQQFAKMVVKSLDLPVTGNEVSPFTDVAANLDKADRFYPDKYVAVCAAHHITEGKTVTAFAPYDNLTRAQLITMVARAAGLPDPPAGYSPPFPDFSPDHYAWARKAAFAGLLDD